MKNTVSKICIIGLDDYPLLAGETETSLVGGECVQRVMLARAWRDLGLDVSIVVHDYGQGARREIEGIRAIAAHRPDEGVPMLRFVHPRMTRLLAALISADADVYYQSCAGAYTGITSWFSRSAGKRFVYRVASDVDCQPGQQLIEFWRDKKLFEYGLRRADLVAAQTAHQARMLLENYCVASSVVNLAVDMPLQQSTAPKDIDVLWVSNLQPVKRPELALELARRMPRVRFTMIGGPMPAYRTYYDDVLEAAARLKNVRMAGPVRYADVGDYFDRARIFLNTSSVEGFPNTYLQSWVRGVPVVSFFDPDGLVQKQQLGWPANSLDDMREAIENILADDERREAMSRRAREFARSEFSPPAVAGRYLDLLNAREQPRLRFGTTG
ncbi:MAG TPA: glycosyltransferase family 4 protein [Steroidobacteraceae bacterium]|nr:glycosyltransferase family 4 protein [Steroidobacteraceae bacterium]